jgi:hypothetical protein
MHPPRASRRERYEQAIAAGVDPVAAYLIFVQGLPDPMSWIAVEMQIKRSGGILNARNTWPIYVVRHGGRF